MVTSILKDKKNSLFIILSGIFITNALIAELIGGKIFSAEKSLGFQPLDIPLFGDFLLQFNLTAGVVLWPVVFITTDIINEYFGKKGVQRITFITVGLITYAFLVIYLAMKLAPADFWLSVNATNEQGEAFDINYAFEKVLSQGLNIIFASLVAFVIGQLVDVSVFHRLRKMTGPKRIWLRATGSTLISQLIDSFVVLFVAFYFLGPWSITQVLAVGLTNYIYKFLIAILLTPILYVAHYLIDNYLGKETAEAMMAEASSQDT
ncbi:MAG: queuosine precursor transporter [Roseivirga sp.]|uniref:queuosine precursor transporter n=1 Tax=Roseivirga sp. TaxID=1964215 RepID=UPI001B0CF5E6|nr:queuosine precursor transporter [Roseivirga sp.]MBO6659326.1 queuosine precursor transporter [Roseivirga sp.]MBO6761185.1 queuosine precursor transporter [Roseivirga sp.]MBO6907937.1 queuosine precursor transporter [Roseivirga sp.]